MHQSRIKISGSNGLKDKDYYNRIFYQTYGQRYGSADIISADYDWNSTSKDVLKDANVTLGGSVMVLPDQWSQTSYVNGESTIEIKIITANQVWTTGFNDFVQAAYENNAPSQNGFPKARIGNRIYLSRAILYYYSNE